MQRQNYAAVAGIYSGVSAGALLYSLASPGPDFELANAYPSSPYLATAYPNLAKVSQGRMGKIIEASANYPPSFKTLKIPGTEHYFAHGNNNATLYYRNFWNGAWSSVGASTGGRSGGGETLLTKCVFFTDAAYTLFVNAVGSYVNINIQFRAMAEGNGRLIGGRSGQLSYSNNITTPSFTDYALAGNWVKIFWCGGNNWVAFADNGDIAKSTDNGTTWAKTTSITNKGAPNGKSWGWGTGYQVAYDSINDKFYIAVGTGVYTASLATVNTAWTLEATPDVTNAIDTLEMTKYGLVILTLGGTWTCKRGTTTYRKISSTFIIPDIYYANIGESSDGYVLVESGAFISGSPTTRRIANGIDTFDPNRDLAQGDLNPYLKFR